jgi:hypothetical protein
LCAFRVSEILRTKKYQNVSNTTVPVPLGKNSDSALLGELIKSVSREAAQNNKTGTLKGVCTRFIFLDLA